MKKLVFIIAIVFSTTIYSQSAYNSGKVINNKEGYYDEWSLDDGCEFFFTDQTIEGYYSSFDTLISILSFYNIPMNKTIKNEGTPNLDYAVYTTTSNDLLSGKATIAMVWSIEKNYNLVWHCNSKNNKIGIMKKE